MTHLYHSYQQEQFAAVVRRAVCRVYRDVESLRAQQAGSAQGRDKDCFKVS